MFLRWIALLLVIVCGAPAAAQPAFDYTVTRKVRIGKEQPGLTLTTRTALTRVTLDLTRDDGTRVTRAAGPVPAGQVVTFTWEQPAGKQRYQGEMSLSTGPNQDFGLPLSFSIVVGKEVVASLVPGSLDLGARSFQITLDQPAGGAELTLIGEGGASLGKDKISWAGEAPKTPLTVTWSDPGATLLKLDIAVTAADGFPGRLVVYPWSYHIPHEEVEFESGKAIVRPSEAPKLEKSLGLIQEAVARYGDVVEVNLYIAGYTDTVDSADYNLGLSRQRAQAIAVWFRKAGFKGPIFYQGFGEGVLAVPTADNTAEPANRRALYVLSADAPSSRDFPAGNWVRLK